MVPAVPTALEAHERVGGPAATRQSVLVRAVIASYTRPTPIEIPILPIMIVFLGVVVGGMIVAMYLPIFDMVNSVK